MRCGPVAGNGDEWGHMGSQVQTVSRLATNLLIRCTHAGKPSIGLLGHLNGKLEIWPSIHFGLVGWVGHDGPLRLKL